MFGHLNKRYQSQGHTLIKHYTPGAVTVLGKHWDQPGLPKNPKSEMNVGMSSPRCQMGLLPRETLGMTGFPEMFLKYTILFHLT